MPLKGTTYRAALRAPGSGGGGWGLVTKALLPAEME